MTSVDVLQPDDVVFGPQPGPQEAFLSTPADICIYGGMAGGGKTWSLIFEPLRHIVPSQRHPLGVFGFTAVIFRRVAPQIRNEGGLWDESAQLYPNFEGEPRETITEWRWDGGQTVRFASMQHEQDRLNWQGSQIPFIGFDELTHFTAAQFWYMLSRNRSTCGVRPYVRATTNPDADSWVADLIEWWIDQDKKSPTYGLPLPDRAGVLRWFLRQGEVIRWADTPEELYQYLPKELMARGVDPKTLVKSMTFIPASVYDNKKLLETNPEYLGNLLSLPLIERERLLGGNWKIRPTAGKVFNTSWFDNKRVPAAPNEVVKRIRAWDKAGTDELETDGGTPYTAGVLMSKVRVPGGYNYYIENAKKQQLSSMARERWIQRTAAEDPDNTRIWIEQEPGSGGKESAEASVRGLSGYRVRTERVTGDKVSRAMPLSAQCEAGNVYIVDDGTWDVDAFLTELHNFPDQKLKDFPDAASLAFNKLAGVKGSKDAEDFEDVTG